MNRLYIDGKIASEPVFKMESGEVPHLTFWLGVRHKTRSGETRFEYYRVSAWHRTALWARSVRQRGGVSHAADGAARRRKAALCRDRRGAVPAFERAG